MGYAGSDWIEQSLKKELSPLGRSVADILGAAFLGIYHMDHRGLEKADWSNPRWIEVRHFGSLATVDFNTLTRLVVLCHNKMIRMSVEPLNFQYLKLMFHQRESRTGSVSERCPDILDHVRLIEKHYGIERINEPLKRLESKDADNSPPEPE